MFKITRGAITITCETSEELQDAVDAFRRGVGERPNCGGGRRAARNLIRANVPERVAMLLTGHKSRAIFDRYNIINEQELLDAGDQLVAYLAQQAQTVPARRRPHTAAPAAPRTASPLRLVRRGTA